MQRAQFKQLGFSVALKTYEKKQLTHKSQLMAVHREIYILASLRHENIMQLFEVIDTPNRVHLVMELCSGKNLYNYLKKRPDRCLTESEAKPLFLQIV